MRDNYFFKIETLRRQLPLRTLSDATCSSLISYGKGIRHIFESLHPHSTIVYFLKLSPAADCLRIHGIISFMWATKSAVVIELNLWDDEVDLGEIEPEATGIKLSARIGSRSLTTLHQLRATI